MVDPTIVSSYLVYHNDCRKRWCCNINIQNRAKLLFSTITQMDCESLISLIKNEFTVIVIKMINIKVTVK